MNMNWQPVFLLRSGLQIIRTNNGRYIVKDGEYAPIKGECLIPLIGKFQN